MPGRLVHIILTIMLVVYFGHRESVAQDPVFSQFYSAPLQLNPGLAGIAYGANFSINYRNQWPSLNNAYQTYAVSYDQFFDEFNSGIGIYVQSDNAGNGILKTNKVGAIYSYRVRINRQWEMRLGIEAGFFQTRLDWSKLVFLDQLDPEFGPISPGGTPYPSEEVQPEDLNRTLFDMSVGGVVYSEKLYVGVTLKHLNTPGQGYLDINNNLTGGLPIRWSVHAGSEFKLKRGNNRYWSPFISPGVMFVGQGASRQINVGSMIGFGEFYGGVWYRHANKNPDAVIGVVGFRTGAFKITYSYDATISKLSFNSGGAHEIGINITIDNGPRESIYNDCFSIFR
jgi:type IX secretion system PorP/SprF family membrane protein